MSRRNLISETREAELREELRILKPILDHSRKAWDLARLVTYQASVSDRAAGKAYREILDRIDLIHIELGEDIMPVDYDAAEERAEWENRDQMEFDDGDSRRKDELETRGKAG